MSTPAPTPLHHHIAQLVARHGPLPFSTVMDSALYDETHGFYTAAGGAAGRRGDFITSPEVGPLFGAVIARALDSTWDELGRPDPFVVVEGGAGVGTLAVAVLAASPRCASALRYVMVERSPVLRARQRTHLAIAEPATALGVPGGHDGPVVASLGELPSARITGVVLANELLDNLAFDLLERTPDGWSEVRVGVDSASADLRLNRHLVPAGDAARGAGERFAPAASVGAVVPWQRGAAEWIADAYALLDRGRLLILDYAVRTTAELGNRPVGEWLRTYRGHQRVDDPLEDLGTADITVDVAADQLDAAVGHAAVVRTQAELLRVHGIDDLVARGRREWTERAAVGDLAAIKARSRVREADALLDPQGLGGFLVLQWSRGMS
ncbi:MAG: SAM-dependent methyltransferase [Acidimicrobiia bacterium]|nr:SAM-dependent methyltransferase [Acidimicrobiia bacterium]